MRKFHFRCWGISTDRVIRALFLLLLLLLLLQKKKKKGRIYDFGKKIAKVLSF